MARNRMFKPSFFRDEKTGQLSFMEQVLFLGLLSFADDNGVGRANPMLIKADIFPYKNLRESDMQKALDKFAKLRLVLLYTIDGQKYYFVKNFSKHQVINRPTPSSLPMPPEDVLNGESEYSVSNTGGLSEDSVRTQCQRKEKKREIKEKEIKEKEVLLSGAEDDFAPDQKPVILLPLNDNTEYPVLENNLQEWKKLYPSVDIDQELRSMRGWLLSNPTRRKTKTGIMRFINNWLSKEQDRGGKTIDRQQTKTNPQLVKSKPFVDLNPDNDDDFLSKLEEALVDPWDAFQ